ncbi:MAG: FHA domain-containing protein [Acidobacteria bacterium]|nr:FHA domain-containing protein [Acidobacteriota bacterium]MYG75369.1 FHA domain-containing protein [Acidobacteriota bacterium]
MKSGPTPGRYALVVENVRSGTTPGERLEPPARYEVRNRETSIGRSPECAIRLDDIFVSRKHARLVLRDFELHLEDLQSTNQSRVNGAPVPTRVRIHPGDVLLFGGARCRIESTAGVDAAAPAAQESTRPEERADAGETGEMPPAAAGPDEPSGAESMPWPPAEPPRLHVAGPLPGEPGRTRLRVLAVVVATLAIAAAVLSLR